jgi:hypothetical protein
MTASQNALGVACGTIRLAAHCMWLEPYGNSLRSIIIATSYLRGAVLASQAKNRKIAYEMDYRT